MSYDARPRSFTPGNRALGFCLCAVVALLVGCKKNDQDAQTAGYPQGQTQPPPGTQPAATQPAGTQPAGTQPAGTQPAGTQPAGTQPTGTQPAGTQPAGTQPAGTQPAGTQPASGGLKATPVDA